MVEKDREGKERVVKRREKRDDREKRPAAHYISLMFFKGLARCKE